MCASQASETPSSIPTNAGSSGLNLDGGSGLESAPQAVQASGAHLPSVVLIILLMIAVAVAAYVFGQRRQTKSAMFDLGLIPLSTKLVILFMLMIYGATHLLAAGTVYFNTRVIYASAQEYFSYIKPARLAALSHAHLMGIATMEGLVAVLYTLTRRSNGFTSAVVAITFIGVFGDIASWWAVKYFGGSYDLLSMVNGLFFSGGFLIMTIALTKDIFAQELRRSST